MELSEQEWKDKLSPDQYRILRGKGTEQAFTGDLLDEKRTGIFTCAACDAELFSSNHKFESGSGWPSFYDVAKTDAVELHSDKSFGMERVEVTCSNCGGHLGHLFNDGPRDQTGKRFCINSVSLDFKEKN